MTTILGSLRTSRMFDGLTEDELARVADSASEHLAPIGTLACRQGEKAGWLTILASGRLKAMLADNGSERVIGTVEPGESFGELALFESGNYVATITASEDSRLLTIPSQAFLEFVSTIPQVGRNLIKSLAGRLKQVVRAPAPERRAQVVGVVYSGMRGRNLLRHLADGCSLHGERVFVLDRGEREPSGPAALRGRIAELSPNHDRMFVDFPLDAAGTGFAAAVSLCDKVLWLVEPSDESRPREALVALLNEARGVAERVRVAWVLRETDRVAPECHPSWKLGHRHFKVELNDPPGAATRRQRQGIARLVRWLRGIRLGLVLGGGGARGMAHLGVLRAFDNAGIDFDMMAGTSAGALVGITYAAGHSPDYGVEAFTRELTTPGWLRRLPAGRNWNLLAKFRTRSWEPMLRRHFHDWTLERLPIPFHSVTADLVSAAEVVRDSGDAAHAFLESINLPVISRPICRHGMTLVDGAVLNNLPADVLSRRGADVIVAVTR